MNDPRSDEWKHPDGNEDLPHAQAELTRLREEARTLTTRAERAEEAVVSLMEIIRDLEWTRDADDGDGAYCIGCMSMDGDGTHTAGCPIAQAMIDAGIIEDSIKTKPSPDGPTDPTRG